MPHGRLFIRADVKETVSEPALPPLREQGTLLPVADKSAKIANVDRSKTESAQNLASASSNCKVLYGAHARNATRFHVFTFTTWLLLLTRYAIICFEFPKLYKS